MKLKDGLKLAGCCVAFPTMFLVLIMIVAVIAPTSYGIAIGILFAFLITMIAAMYIVPGLLREYIKEFWEKQEAKTK